MHVLFLSYNAHTIITGTTIAGEVFFSKSSWNNLMACHDNVLKNNWRKLLWRSMVKTYNAYMWYFQNWKTKVIKSSSEQYFCRVFVFVYFFFWETNILYITLPICTHVLTMFFATIKKPLTGMKRFGLFFREKLTDQNRIHPRKE